MNNKNVLFLAFSFWIFPALAKVKFNCYALNFSAQAYEAGRVNCGTKETKDLKENGLTTVTCLYQAICEVLNTNEKPTVLSSSDITNMMVNNQFGSFKMSAITCRGEGLIKNGTLVNPKCKAPKECQDDILFNAAMTYNVGVHENATLESPNLTKPTGVQK